jgi:hypothetical protein
MKKHKLLLLGIGNGFFDEHDDRKEKSSCIQLIVEYLGLMKDKRNRKIYGKLIEYINYEDSHGDNAIKCLNKVTDYSLGKPETDLLQKLQIGALAQNLKKGFEAAGENAVEIQKIFAQAFQFYQNEISQAKIFVDTEALYDKTPKNLIDIFVDDDPKPFVLLEMQSDAVCMNKVIHSKWRENRDKKLGVLFLHKTNGQFVLMPNGAYITTEHMREVVKILRYKIAQQRKLTEQIRFNNIGNNQSLDLIPEVYFDENTGIISNGSKVDPDVPGLVGKELSVESIIEAIQIGLDGRYFPRQFKQECANGNCARGRCFMYNYGLSRCHRVRDAHQGQIGKAMEKRKVS